MKFYIYVNYSYNKRINHINCNTHIYTHMYIDTRLFSDPGKFSPVFSYQHLLLSWFTSDEKGLAAYKERKINTVARKIKFMPLQVTVIFQRLWWLV